MSNETVTSATDEIVSQSALSTPANTPGLDQPDDAWPSVNGDDADPAGDASEDLLAELPDTTEVCDMTTLPRVATLVMHTQEIEVTHARLKTLAHLRLQRFGKNLRRLCLRQNAIRSLVYASEDAPAEASNGAARQAPLESLTALEDLDLYDNQLSSVEGLSGLSALKSLDLSFNLLRHVPTEVLSTMTSLTTLYLIQNKIHKIEGLETLAPTLEYIEFGGNKLRAIEGLSTLTNLTQVWLGKNKITSLEGLSSLVHLRVLSIQSNRITVLKGLETLTRLEEFYISHNGLTSLGGLEHNNRLKVLDVAANGIVSIVGISHLTELQEFWANSNQITAFSDIETQLVPLKKLETVYLEGNPLQKDLASAYRRRLIVTLPQVKQIDATYVK